MKMNELPEEFTSSDIIGEMFAWNLLTLLIEEIPESAQKEKILETIEKRQEILIDSEI